MKVAIPTFGSRVSPRFDCADAFLVIDAKDGIASDRKELTAIGWAPHERINRLIEIGIDTVLCGGIDCWSVASLQSVGITVYASVTGEYEEALASLLQGELDTSSPPGGRRRHRCRRFQANTWTSEQTSTQVAGPGYGRGLGRGLGRGQGRGQGQGQGAKVKAKVKGRAEGRAEGRKVDKAEAKEEDVVAQIFHEYPG